MNELEQLSTELDSMAIILHSGNAKSCAYEALSAAKSNDFKICHQKCDEAKYEIRLAHKAHAELLRRLASDNNMHAVDLLLVHAEGHLSSTDIAIDMIKEFCEIYKWKEDCQK